MDDDNGSNAGSAYVFERNQGGADNWGQVAKLTASDGAANDLFGWPVAISGNTVLVGSSNSDSGSGLLSGSAYVFARNQGGADNWGQVAKLTASDGDAYDYFGISVALDDDTLIIGASGDDDNGDGSGSVYIFARSQDGGNEWLQESKPIASDGAASDYFGRSVAVSGDILVVGANYDDDNGSASGSAYVFARNQGGTNNWGQVAKLTASDGAASDWFGISVAISGDTIVVGAYGDDDKGSWSGSAYVFARNQGGADNWGQVTKLTASDGAANDHFGLSVSVSGSTLVVGARFDDDNGTNSGSAYVFVCNQGGIDNWGQLTKLTAGDAAADDHFGRAVSISGDTVVVGADGDDDNGDSSGSAYVFARNQGGADNWGQVAKLTASDGALHDVFGASVSISSDTVVVGAGGDDDNGDSSGSAYVFARNQGGIDNWGQVAKLTANDGASDDSFGTSVSISSDTVVVGADADDDYTGSAYVFVRNQGGADNWGQVAKLTASDGTEGDVFGHSVSISDDTVLAGAYGDNASAGSAYVYRWTYLPPPDLSIAKTVTPVSAAPGDTITYTITFSNAGQGTATGVVITDSIPVSVTNTSVISSGVTITQTAPGYVWDVADLALGMGGIITITGVLSNPLPAGVLTNTATITTTTAVEDDLTNNSSTAGITVTAINNPPVTDAGPNQSVDPGSTVTLDGSASFDPDGNEPLTYLWVQTGGPTVTLSDATVAMPTFTAPSSPTVLTFSLTATDSLGLADPTPDEVVVTVTQIAFQIYLPLVIR